MFGIHFFLEIGLIVFFLGVFGIFQNKRNILISVISIEVMFYGLNFFLIGLSVYLNDILGEIFSLFILTLAAGESALSLALITAYFRVFADILICEF